MLPGPIFYVDLVTTARRARHYSIRAIYAGVLLVVMYGNYYDPYGRGTYTIHEVAEMAQNFFNTFAIVQLIAVAALAPALAAGTVAQERERRTIEYLFATDLSNAEIVLGRLAARMLLVGCTILVGLPIVALAMLFGGIAAERMLIVFALTLCTALMITSLSITISVGTPKARDAVLRCYAILLALWFVPPSVEALLGYWSAPNWSIEACQALGLLSPFQVLVAALWSGSLDWSAIGGVLIAQGVTAALCMGTAVALVRRIHLRAAGIADRAPAPWVRQRLFQRRRPVGDRAMLWKELFAPQSKVRLGFFGRLSLMLLTLLSLAVCFHALENALQATPSFYFTGIGYYLMEVAPISDLIACCGILAIAARAASSITTERERQCWDSLITTSLEAREIVWAKIYGGLYSARWLVALLSAMWGIGVVIDVAVLWPTLFGLGALLVVLFFSCALGVFVSARGNSSLRAMGITLGTLVFVGGGYLFCCAPLMFGHGSRGSEIILAPCIPFLVICPLMLSSESGGGRETAEMLLPFVVGNLGYLIAGFVLAAAAENRLLPEDRPSYLPGEPSRPAAPELA